MKILFVVPYTPNLVRVRPYNLIRALAARGNAVTVATLTGGPDDTADVRRLEAAGVRVISARLTRWRSALNCLLAVPSRMPLQAAFCWQPELAAMIRREMAAGGFDAVHVEHLRGARFGLALLDGNSVPVVWDSVDSITHLFRQASARANSIKSKAMARVELKRTQSYEGWLARQFARVLVTSPIDRQAFLELAPDCEDRLVVLPNGVDLDYFRPDGEAPRAPAELVISGKMSYHANIAMVLHLVKDIMPQVWAERPDVKLTIVGKDPPRQVLALTENPSILVTGSVPDVRPYLQRATSAVAPITYGAGIQNKVLEALACSTPVVASPQAVSALQIRAGEEILVAGEPREFARQLLLLLADPALQHRLGEAGRQFVERQHSWDSAAARLEEIYQAAGRENRPA
ncbi:glycosyltransferase [Longilinea arvoryzae]|uniref:Glycosyltransferase n=1 Tax=Longilinea arvoryzae TaxID=360412 RepID=A0A0S7BH20_9CHLR|nr:glycosyltransferase [Longilinea arvoryzae]GAP13480.1 glycosyltransferase [Longilinea arvoryzae]